MEPPQRLDRVRARGQLRFRLALTVGGGVSRLNAALRLA
jgi:hypothetical protein